MERYVRNIALKEINEEGQDKLREAKVLICGCGGLGSAVVANLAALGVGTLGLVDSDVVELSNLNRQFIHKTKNIGKKKVLSALEWINDFNPEINVKTFDLRLDKNNYNDVVFEFDYIVDCFDSYNSKFLLNDIALITEKPLIHGGVSEFFGQVTSIIPKKTACLRCFLTNIDTNIEIPKGVVSPAVSTIGSIQAMEVLKLILGLNETLSNILLTFNGLTLEFKKLKLNKNLQCERCGIKY